MKKLLLLSSMMVIALSCFAQQEVWWEQASGLIPPSSGVRQVIAVDTNVVWISTYDGDPATGGLPRKDYSKTIDGGTTWIAGTVPTTTTWDWASLIAVDDSFAWAGFYHAGFLNLGQIWHTTDGGTTWTQQGANTLFVDTVDSFLNNLYFWDRNDGVALGDVADGRFEIYTTDNGGATWDSVLAANIAPPNDSGEAGWTAHYDVFGDTIWFDTNQGRVYRSVDRGHNWTAYDTGLPVATGDAIDICFYSGMNGIARLYAETATSASQSCVRTTDGGQTWTAFTPIGDLYGGDIKYVPGTTSMLVSTGISNASKFTGTSYSNDGGLTWITIERGVQRGSLGVADSLTMWCGGFTVTPTEGGMYKFTTVPTVLCTDPSISAGVTSVNKPVICFNDTMIATATGFVTPEDGFQSGIGWILSTADISGNTDPLNDPSALISFSLEIPAQSPTSTRMMINDGLLIGSSAGLPYGTWYITPVVFGNAIVTDSVAPWTALTTLFNLTLDVNCTYTGTSVRVDFIDPTTIPCYGVGVQEINSNQLVISSSVNDNTLDVLINSAISGNATIEVRDIAGRIVNRIESKVSTGANHELINISGLASGTYVINATVNGIQATNKVVKY